METPEQTDLQFALAGVGSRALALMLDTLLQIAVFIVIGITLAFTVSRLKFDVTSASGIWVGALVIGFGFVLLNGYFAVFEILWNGQTPGKRWIGLRVVKESGRPLTVAETIGRNLLRIVDQLPGFYGVALITAMLNEKNRRLGDYVAGSIVVRESSFADIRPHWQSPRTRDSVLGPTPGVESLTPEELILIDSFLRRRNSLPGNVRSRLAQQIMQRLAEKIAFTPEQWSSQERTIEVLAQERRGLAG